MPDHAHVRFAASYSTSRHAGGDYYDVLPLGPDLTGEDEHQAQVAQGPARGGMAFQNPEAQFTRDASGIERLTDAFSVDRRPQVELRERHELDVLGEPVLVLAGPEVEVVETLGVGVGAIASRAAAMPRSRCIPATGRSSASESRSTCRRCTSTPPTATTSRSRSSASATTTRRASSSRPATSARTPSRRSSRRTRRRYFHACAQPCPS
mgnify:CR=1 FL=1